jgi:hypothetical protein
MMDSTAEDHELNGKLYKALLNEDEEKVIRLCEGIEDHALHKLTIHNDTVLHKAAYSKQTNLVHRLLEKLQSDDHLYKMTQIKNSNGNTILHEAATLDQACIAKEIFEKAPDLLSARNDLGETALFRAARYGKTECFNFLADEIIEYDEAGQKPFVQRNDKTTILHMAILAQHFG